VTDVYQRIECRWCHAHNATEARSCDRCGAPLDARDTVSDSGWREAPMLRDLTELHWSESSCQVGTGVVPVVEVTLSPEDSVYFEHYAMLWKDETVAMSVMSTPGGVKRLLSGMPFVLSVARGPGRVAFSRDAEGEIVVLPMDDAVEVDVREHALVLATTSLGYTFEKLPGARAMLAAETGMYLDRYSAQSGPGLLVLHGYGNIFERPLGSGETVLVEPGAFFYKDSSVGMEVVSINMKADFQSGAPPPSAPAPEEQAASKQGGLFGRGLRGLKAATSAVNVGALASAAGSLRSGGGIQGVLAGLASGGGSTLLRMSGPGRVGIQSMWKAHKTG
jgi:uncharacterized protein (AIM24 family)